MTNTSSLSLLQSRQRQLNTYLSDLTKIESKISDYSAKVSANSSKLAELRIRFQKELASEQKKQFQLQEKLLRDLHEQLGKAVQLTSNPSSSTRVPDSNKKFNFFISHASEDKNDFVRELANALQIAGFTVWFDEFELKIGDSLRKKIDQGLINSDYGLVIISPDFIQKGWTEYELNGMTALEINGRKVILPIWHKVSKDEVLRFSPSLADKLALNTSIHSVDDIVLHLKNLFV